MQSTYATNYRDLVRTTSVKQRLRAALRDTALFLMALKDQGPNGAGWLRFPYYHYVFDDEKKGFDRQLRYMKNFGEFISLDDAAVLLRDGTPFRGRYFCITFDDGFKNFATNAAPIMAEYNCPSALFLPTDYIGLKREQDGSDMKRFYVTARPIEFLTWDDCRTLARAGITIGSHTCGHARLSELAADAVIEQLSKSKETIETQLGVSCRHFSSPYGKPGHDYRPDEIQDLAPRLGYDTFLTTVRGLNTHHTNPYDIRRDLLCACWGNFQLKHFFSGGA